MAERSYNVENNFAKRVGLMPKSMYSMGDDSQQWGSRNVNIGKGFDSSFPPEGRAQPAHLGSQSDTPSKETE